MTVKLLATLTSVCFSAAFALTAAMATSSSAEEAAPQPPSDAKAASSSAHSPDSTPAGNNSPTGAPTNEEIDTRITVQPHGPSAGKPNRLGGATNPIVPLKLVNPHRRTFSPSRAANHLAPSALGIPGLQRPNVQQNLGERFEYRGVGQKPTGGAGGVTGLGLGKPASALGHPPVVQSIVVSPGVGGPKTVIHGGIGGPSQNHRAGGSSTAGIGGPARTVTGINGTSIHETR